MFAGFTSRCTNPRAWAASHPAATASTRGHTRAGGQPPPPRPNNRTTRYPAKTVPASTVPTNLSLAADHGFAKAGGLVTDSAHRATGPGGGGRDDPRRVPDRAAGRARRHGDGLPRRAR